MTKIQLWTSSISIPNLSLSTELDKPFLSNNEHICRPASKLSVLNITLKDGTSGAELKVSPKTIISSKVSNSRAVPISLPKNSSGGTFLSIQQWWFQVCIITFSKIRICPQRQEHVRNVHRTTLKNTHQGWSIYKKPYQTWWIGLQS